MSSKVVVECTFSNFDKKKRKEKLKGNKTIARDSLENNEIDKNMKELSRLINTENAHFTNYECLNNECKNSAKSLLNNNEVSDKGSSQKCEYEMKTIFSVSNEKHCEHLSEIVEDALCD